MIYLKKLENKEVDYFDFNSIPGKSIKSRISQNSGKPLISVVTNYTLKDDIKQLYKSLYNQTFPFFEWLIIANQMDETLNELLKQDKRVRVLIYNDNTSHSIFFASQNATTELILLLKENDLVDPTYLETGYFSMFTNKDAKLAISKSVCIGNKNMLLNQNLLKKEEMYFENLKSGVFVSKEKILGIEKYRDLPFNPYDEIEYWIYFLSKIYLTANMDYYGVWHKGCFNKNANKEKLKDIKNYIENNFRSELDEENIKFEELHKIGFEDIPQKINISKKPIVKSDDKKRILFILPWAIIGGADLFNYNLIHGLKEKGYEITVITTKKCDYELRPKLEKCVDEYFDLTTFLREKDWAGFIYYIINSRKINLAFISNSYFGYYVLPWLKYHFKNIPFVDYIHAENWTLRNGGFPKDSNSVANYLDSTFTCTKHLKEVMFKIMKRNIKNVKPIYIGTDTEYYNPNLIYEGQAQLKEKYKDKKVILFISRMVHYKRPIFAIRVLQEIIKERKDVVLLLVGDGAALNDVRKYVKDNNLEEYVHIFAMQQEVRKFYNIADVTVVCSLREGLTLTTYESLSMGVPVVSADIGGQKELIGNDVGHLVKPYQDANEQFNFNYSDDEINEYKKCILDIIDNKEEIDYKKVCRNKVIKKFSIQKMINDIDKEITHMIEVGSNVEQKYCDNIEFAERYFIVHSMLENLSSK